MCELYLMEPDSSLADKIASYRQEFLEAGSSMDGCGSLRTLENPMDWLAQSKALLMTFHREGLICLPSVIRTSYFIESLM